MKMANGEELTVTGKGFINDSLDEVYVVEGLDSKLLSGPKMHILR
jgi:hypothetical protein